MEKLLINNQEVLPGKRVRFLKKTSFKEYFSVRQMKPQSNKITKKKNSTLTENKEIGKLAPFPKIVIENVTTGETVENPLNSSDKYEYEEGEIPMDSSIESEIETPTTSNR